jgi:predicted RNA binding protein YcfA (HicA-like mRNA interferase family)
MGMKDIPVGPGTAHVKAFERAGWTVARRQGDHEIMTKPGHTATLSVPLHRPECRRGTIDALIKAAGLTIEEYRAFYYKGKRR